MTEQQKVNKKHFRVAIFGSARLEKDNPIYTSVFTLAKMISGAGMDIVTGGGPGLMDAASAGHHAGRKDEKVHSIGLRIRLPFEEREATHLDIKSEFSRFSSRLDNFMQFSNVVVVASGGVGTLLEFFYTWQLLQVRHICNIPIILLGDMWQDLVRWVKKWPLKNRLLYAKDLELLFLAKTCHEAFKIIEKTYEGFKNDDKNFCSNYQKYGLYDHSALAHFTTLV